MISTNHRHIRPFHVCLCIYPQSDRLAVVSAACGEMAASVLALVPVVKEIRALVSDRYRYVHINVHIFLPQRSKKTVFVAHRANLKVSLFTPPVSLEPL